MARETASIGNAVICFQDVDQAARDATALLRVGISYVEILRQSDFLVTYPPIRTRSDRSARASQRSFVSNTQYIWRHSCVGS
jgi:hypothetical protein